MFNLLHFRTFFTFLRTYYTCYHKNMLSYKFWRGQMENFANFSTQILWIHKSRALAPPCPLLWTPMDVIINFRGNILVWSSVKKRHVECCWVYEHARRIRNSNSLNLLTHFLLFDDCTCSFLGLALVHSPHSAITWSVTLSTVAELPTSQLQQCCGAW